MIILKKLFLTTFQIFAFYLCIAPASQNEHALFLSDEPRTASASSILLVSTLGGSLYRLDAASGRALWTIQESPVLTSNNKKGPMIFVDPSDGAMYELSSSPDSTEQRFTRYPHTLMELVAKCPIRIGSRLLLCSGSKKDTWFNIDAKNGTVYGTSGVDWHTQHCPHSDAARSSLLLGRSEMTLALRDPETNQIIWDITLNTYHPHIPSVPNEYGYKHFSSSQTGTFMTLDAKTNQILWSINLDSPVIGLYNVPNDRTVQRLKVFSFDLHTLQYLVTKTSQLGTNYIDLDTAVTNTILSTVYIGADSQEMPYAMCSGSHEVDKVKNVNRMPLRRLIAGPLDKEQSKRDYALAVQGHYITPPIVDPPPLDQRWQLSLVSGETILPSGENHTASQALAGRAWSEWILMSILLVLLAMLGYVIVVLKSLTAQSAAALLMPQPIAAQNSNHSMSSSSGSSAPAASPTVNEVAFSPTSPFDCDIERRLPDKPHWTLIGNIQFDTQALLGTGGQGTRVYKGNLRDGRIVAVKRLLRDHQTLATHEYKQLMHYDNDHVIKYHWNECSNEFFYIALDYCDGTLEDYSAAENAESSFGLDTKQVLRQITTGVKYLHTVGLLHRDLKPKNVLLRRFEGTGQYRVVISDFGLSKQFTRKDHGCSEATLGAGTLGWMAPESMLRTHLYPPTRAFITKMADIFSLGCIFYFVASRGHHPFGDDFTRQHNIQKECYSFPHELKDLTLSDSKLLLNLVEKMISHVPDIRPAADQVLEHAFFWTPLKQLQFICHVSNYVEQHRDTPQCLHLLQASREIIRQNWLDHLPMEFVVSLRDKRTYLGTSIIHLLRAIRNKHNHFLELPAEVLASFGGTSESYAQFFMDKFPLLLLFLYDWSCTHCGGQYSFSQFLPCQARSLTNPGAEGILSTCAMTSSTNNNEWLATSTDSNLFHDFVTKPAKKSKNRPRTKKKGPGD